MKSIAKTFGFAILLLFVVACATKAVDSAVKVDHGVTKELAKANFSGEQLEQGQALFETSCTKCHKLFEPDSRDAAKWNNVLDRMLPKTGLVPEDGRLIQAYLLANSK